MNSWTCDFSSLSATKYATDLDGFRMHQCCFRCQPKANGIQREQLFHLFILSYGKCTFLVCCFLRKDVVSRFAHVKPSLYSRCLVKANYWLWQKRRQHSMLGMWIWEEVMYPIPSMAWEWYCLQYLHEWLFWIERWIYQSHGSYGYQFDLGRSSDKNLLRRFEVRILVALVSHHIFVINAIAK